MQATEANTEIVKPYTVTPDEKSFYDKEGYVVFRSLIEPEQAEALRRDVMGVMDAIGLGVVMLRQTCQYYKGSVLDKYVHSEPLRQVASQLVGGEASLYLPFTAVKSGNGGGAFSFHQDNQYTHFDGPAVNLWMALTPMTVENGCLQVAPRSHLQGALEAEDVEGPKRVKVMPGNFINILMSPGDCVAFTRLTVHGSGPNSTAEHRVAYAMQYHRDDVSYQAKKGEWIKLKEHPKYTDIHGVSVIVPPEGKRDGH